jgi:hypothetical protein
VQGAAEVIAAAVAREPAPRFERYGRDGMATGPARRDRDREQRDRIMNEADALRSNARRSRSWNAGRSNSASSIWPATSMMRPR